MSTISRAAEKEVESVLLRAGFNTSVPAVDAGVDILAVRGDQVIRIQVKSCCSIQPDGSYRFDLRKKTKDGTRQPRDWSTEVDYVFFVGGPGLMWCRSASDCKQSALHCREHNRLVLSQLEQEVFA